MASDAAGAFVLCGLLLLCTTSAAVGRYHCPECDKEPAPEVSSLLVSPGCGLGWLANCSVPVGRRCRGHDDCTSGQMCCPAANCPGVAVCRDRPHAASSALTLPAGSSVTLRLDELACREVGQCPAAACPRACVAQEVCALFHDQPTPACTSALALCARFGTVGACPDLGGAVDVRIECAGAGIACVVLDGSPTCRRNQCRGGRTCFVGSPAAGVAHCVDLQPCSSSPCPSGQQCHEQQPHCVTAPCPPVAVCWPSTAGDPAYPCRSRQCPAAQVCVLGPAGDSNARCVATEPTGCILE